ncbi:ubiquitin-domain-containing protein [Alternaria alternata]|nr:ubiquitin-domain-containing protein [Alternaria alternata]
MFPGAGADWCTGARRIITRPLTPSLPQPLPYKPASACFSSSLLTPLLYSPSETFRTPNKYRIHTPHPQSCRSSSRPVRSHRHRHGLLAPQLLTPSQSPERPSPSRLSLLTLSTMSRARSRTRRAFPQTSSA